MSEFDRAVWVLFDSITSGRRLEQRTLEAVLDGLQRVLFVHFGTLTHSQVEEAADDAVARFHEAVRRGAVKTDGNPPAYLVTIAKNAALRELRRPERPAPEPPEDDDAIARLLDAEASAAAIDGAMAKAAQNRDFVVTRLMGVWLILAQETGAQPSQEDVADRANVAQSTVALAWSRFRGYLTDFDESGPPVDST